MRRSTGLGMAARTTALWGALGTALLLSATGCHGGNGTRSDPVFDRAQKDLAKPTGSVQSSAALQGVENALETRDQFLSVGPVTPEALVQGILALMVASPNPADDLVSDACANQLAKAAGVKAGQTQGEFSVDLDMAKCRSGSKGTVHLQGDFTGDGAAQHALNLFATYAHVCTSTTGLTKERCADGSFASQLSADGNYSRLDAWDMTVTPPIPGHPSGERYRGASLSAGANADALAKAALFYVQDDKGADVSLIVTSRSRVGDLSLEGADGSAVCTADLGARLECQADGKTIEVTRHNPL